VFDFHFYSRVLIWFLVAIVLGASFYERILNFMDAIANKDGQKETTITGKKKEKKS
jgi:hypothetical protein